MPFQVKSLQNLCEIGRERWDALVQGPLDHPFLHYDWLESMESTGCVGGSTGWKPSHLTVWEGDRLVGGCPTYLKEHGHGEFVYDQTWAEFADRSGIEYYPKLLVGIPFTPVTGPRFLTAPDASASRKSLVQRMGQALIDIVKAGGLSSIHVNFGLEEESAALEPMGFLPRLGLQFHWHNKGFSDFEGYLDSFRHDRRKKIKRERRAVSDQGVGVRIVEGEAVTPEIMAAYYRLYREHVERFRWGHVYLTPDFFEALGWRFRDRLLLTAAWRGGDLIGGALNVKGPDALYGRYWGHFEEVPFLHFETCYYAPIRLCIERRLGRFEAGAGGEFKQFRGLDPQFTRSLHWIADEPFREALRRHLLRESRRVEQTRDRYMERSPFRRSPIDAD